MKLFLIISLLCFLELVSSDIECRRYYYRREKVTAVKAGYCWKLINVNFTMGGALRQCNSINARLPSVNTVAKAGKLAKFFADSRALYAKGEYGPNYQRVYQQGWPAGDELWVSAIENGKWKSTNMAVSSAAAATADKTLKKGGEHCVVFNYRTSTWRYTNCGMDAGLHPTICEEIEHLYADEEEHDNVSMPPARLPPTTAPPPGSVASCPKPYQLFENRCLTLGKQRGTIMQAEKMCMDTGGKQFWISDSNDKYTLMRFFRSQKNFQFGGWLSRIEGNDRIIKWKSSGTNAWDSVKKFHSGHKGFMNKPEPKLYIDESGRVSHCRVTRNCMPRHPLCVADVVWKPKSDYNAKHGTESDDDYYDDDDDDDDE